MYYAALFENNRPHPRFGLDGNGPIIMETELSKATETDVARYLATYNDSEGLGRGQVVKIEPVEAIGPTGLYVIMDDYGPEAILFETYLKDTTPVLAQARLERLSRQRKCRVGRLLFS